MRPSILIFTTFRNTLDMLDLFGSPQHYSGTKTVVIDTTIEGGNVDYWYQRAKKAEADFDRLLDCNEVNFRNGIEFKATDAALRVIIRRLLEDIKRLSPTHFFLKKNVRDGLYNNSRAFAMNELLIAKKEKAWAIRNQRHASTPDVVDYLSQDK